MKTLKSVFRNSWYVIAATFLLVFCSEVLMGIMKYNTDFDNFYLYPYFGKLALRLFALVGGMCFTCFAGGIFNHKAAGIMALCSTALTVVFSGVPFYTQPNYDWYHIGIVFALLSLAFYYINNCIDSVVHTIFYYIMITALAAVSSDEIEFFIILLSAVVTFAVKRVIVRPNAALVINYVYSVAAIIAMVCMLVEKMDEYLGIKFVEGSRYYPEAALLTTEPFKTAKYFGEIADAPSAFNLAKIFGYYGQAAGTVMCIVIAFFAVSVFVSCFDAAGLSRSGDIIAAIFISVKCIAGFFENFSITNSSYVRIPILCDGISGYLVIGLLVGMLIIPRENLWYIRCLFNSSREEEEEYDDFAADFASQFEEEKD